MTYTEEWVIERARGAYEHGRASFDVRPERAALLVIDMQDEFVRPPGVPTGCPPPPGWCPGCGC
ncbi:hypothetical protein [Actinomadura sp. 3N508]|uniref:hypothetical protein n=1 Tax=Actinomadura sp. 3N508 TaxID=3375153 RepID=UPI0037BC98E9